MQMDEATTARVKAIVTANVDQRGSWLRVQQCYGERQMVPVPKADFTKDTQRLFRGLPFYFVLNRRPEAWVRPFFNAAKSALQELPEKRRNRECVAGVLMHVLVAQKLDWDGLGGISRAQLPPVFPKESRTNIRRNATDLSVGKSNITLYFSLELANPSGRQWKAMKDQISGVAGVMFSLIRAAGASQLVNFDFLDEALQKCLKCRDMLPTLQQTTADDEPSEGMQVEVEYTDGWYPGVVTGVDEIAGGTFSLSIYFECDKSTETNVLYPHPECRRLLAGARKRKRP
jgi:hypothetical protein